MSVTEHIAAVTSASDRKPVILMVDDIPANLGVLFELLGGAGFEVLVAEDGESALQRVGYAHPDLILLDVMMPGMDGFETCRRLKLQPDTCDIPVIFMTALTDTVDKVRGFEIGAVDYITKPFQHEEVLARVNTHLTLQRLKAELQEKEQRLSRIFESALDAIITLDGQGRITLFNRAAEQMFRCPITQVLGHPFAERVAEGFRRVLQDYMTQGEPSLWLPEGLSAVRTDGEVFPVEAALSRVEAGGQTLYTVFLRDINERRKAEAECARLRGINLYLEQEVRAARQFEDIVGDSAALTKVMRNVERVAATDSTVLIAGETGTGKELVARAVHQLSPRKQKPLVTLNCAAIPAGLVESELFGHERGAFTGALARKVGRFELADGSTLFLDEIGELPPDLQAKLLRVLQEGEFERVGGTRTFKVDVRVIAATHRDLAQWVQEGRFRADLFYRLNVFPIALPALRERKEDIPPLVRYFVHRYAAKFGKRIGTISDRTMAALQAYHWPGNVRELQHVIERAVILAEGTRLEIGDGLVRPDPSPASQSVITMEEVERSHILKVLEGTGWRVSGKQGAAELLGLRPTTLEARMKRLGIHRPR